MGAEQKVNYFGRTLVVILCLLFLPSFGRTHSYCLIFFPCLFVLWWAFFFPSKLFGHSFLFWKSLLNKLHIFRMMSICYRRQMTVQVSGSNIHKAYTLFMRGLKWRSLDLVNTLAHITKHIMKGECYWFNRLSSENSATLRAISQYSLTLTQEILQFHLCLHIHQGPACGSHWYPL